MAVFHVSIVCHWVKSCKGVLDVGLRATIFMIRVTNTHTHTFLPYLKYKRNFSNYLSWIEQLIQRCLQMNNAYLELLWVEATGH